MLQILRDTNAKVRNPLSERGWLFLPPENLWSMWSFFIIIIFFDHDFRKKAPWSRSKKIEKNGPGQFFRAIFVAIFARIWPAKYQIGVQLTIVRVPELSIYCANKNWPRMIASEKVPAANREKRSGQNFKPDSCVIQENEYNWSAIKPHQLGTD